METWVGLLDCNNFFVSCERLFRPDLKGRPVMVLSSNDGCVVARSQEIKDKGIPMGIPYFKIKDIVKDIEATTFSSHFTLYRDISRRVFEVMRKELKIVEQYSIDEGFFEIKGEIAMVEAKARRIKDRVEREVGMPVSIGLALSKTQAKYANGVAKKTSGVYVLSDEKWQSKVHEVLLRDLWGVGYRSAEHFKEKGLVTVADLISLERRLVSQFFGVVGVRLWQELQGIQSSEIANHTDPKHSILHSRSFKNTTSDLAVLKDAVAYHIREAAEDLRSQGLKTKALQVTLSTSRHGDFLLQGGSKVAELTAPSDDTFVLVREAIKLTEKIYKPGVPYKKAGILLFGFISQEGEQQVLFRDPQEETTKDLSGLIDTLNNKAGKHSVMIGTRLRTKEWQSLSESKSPAYTTSWKEIVVVKA